MHTKVIRNKNRLGWFKWVHLSDDGVALCGAELDEEAQIEPREGDTHICFSCLQVEAEYSVETITSGQVRRYGPSHYIYEVTDLREKKRERDEVLADCRRVVKAAFDRNDAPHSFAAIVQEFRSIGNGKWKYFVFMESTH